ncbi:MAG TPA: PAS domain S-box protein [Methanospirillum sp.]|nr:PAS domain S-box protein [Methanospirillum sp.]
MNEIGFPADNSIEISQLSGRESIPDKKVYHFIGRFRIRTVLTVSLVIILVCAMGITGLLAFLNSQYAVSELADQLQNEISNRIDQHLDTYLESPHLINQLCQDSIRLGEIDVHDNEGLKRHFQELSYRYKSFESVYYANQHEGNYSIISSVGAPGVAHGTDRFLGFSRKETNFSFEEYRIDREGRIIEKTYEIQNYDPRTRPWYKSAVQAESPTWTPIYMWLEGVVSQDAVVPVYSDKKELLGVLGTSLTLTGIGDFLQDLQISKRGQAFIIEKSGLIVASSKIKEPYKKDNGELVRLSAIECNDSVLQATTQYIQHYLPDLGNITQRQQFNFDLAGERQLVQVTPYHDTYGLDWLIVVVIPESDFMERINSNNQTTVLLIIGSILGTIIICILLARWITDPILSMNQSARALAQGDWKSFTELDRHDELGELSHSFKNMADQLQSAFSSLQASEERYLTLFQSSADAILLFDGFLLLHMNRAGEEMCMISSREATGKDVRDLFGPMGYEISELIESSVSIPNSGYRDQTISRTIGGIEQFMNIRLTQIQAIGKTLSLIHIRDITDQRRAYISFAEQEALRESYSHIQMILQLLPDPTFVIDQGGKVLFWNKAMEKMTGLMADTMIGKGEYVYSEAIHSTKQPILIDLALHEEIPSEDLYPIIERSGDVLKTSFWIETSGELKFLSAISARLFDKNGDVIGAIESIRDITSHKMAEEALLIANKKLNLLSSITRHDIMNKVMISKAYLSLIEESDLNSEQTEYITAIQQSMIAIEHFISFTKTYQEIGLKIPIWQDVRETFSRAAQGVVTGDVVIQIEIQSTSILVDPLFEKVCYNLIENAIRHGSHLTRIVITGHKTNEGLVISVEDDGCGVPDDQKEIIFERGYGKNTGYGLFLTREILSLSEITIVEKGKSGIGCRFDIKVPKGKFIIAE